MINNAANEKKGSDQQEFCGDFIMLSSIKWMNTFLFRNSGKLDISGLSNALNIFKKKNPF